MFLVDFFCTLCYATIDQIQENVYESQFVMKSRDSYNKDLEALGSSPIGTHSRGVKSACCLNKIAGFRVVEGIDPTHTLLEGTVPYELGCVLYKLITVKRFLTLAQFNTRMTYFFGQEQCRQEK